MHDDVTPVLGRWTRWRTAVGFAGQAGVIAVAIGVAACGETATPDPESTDMEGSAAMSGPASEFQWDASWPKALPNNWLVGNVVGVAVDSSDTIWIYHRPLSQAGAENTPPVLAFNQAGDLVNSWGGVGDGPEDWGGPSADGTYEWGTQMHGGYVDYQDNVWVGFGGGLPYEPDKIHTYGNALVLKFTPDGEFLLQLGKWGMTEGSQSEQYLGQPTDIWVDPETDEVYVSDGYANRRVIVFDGTTGEFKRLWGAYGNEPDDGQMPRFSRDGDMPEQFNTPHCLVGSSDGLVYVCDRGNQRIQVFQKDGTFVSEALVSATLSDGSIGGTPWDVAMSNDPEQQYLYVSDGGNHRVHILRRDTLEAVGSFGQRGRWGGQFESPHSLAIDSHGNLFVVETLDGRRAQKFTPTN